MVAIEGLIIGGYLAVGIIFGLGIFWSKLTKYANWLFCGLTVLFGIRLAVLFYRIDGDSFLISYWSDIFIFLIAGVFVLLPASVLANYGVVVSVFLPLVLILGKFINSATFTYRPGLFPAYNEKLLASHVLLMVAGYLSFSLHLISSLLFLRLNHHLKKRGLNNPIAGKWDINLLNKASYRLLLIGFGLISLGLFAGIAFAKPEGAGLLAYDPRLILPGILWAICSFVIVNCQRYGVRGRFLAIWSIIIFVCAMISLAYEFIQL